MTTKNETMGMRIRAKRKALGFTQQYLAEILWVKEETISNYENDKVDIKGSVICKLAEVLETTPDYLLMKRLHCLVSLELWKMIWMVILPDMQIIMP